MKNTVLAPVAVESVCNTVVIAIYALDSNRDEVLAGYVLEGEKPFVPRSYKLYYNAAGEPYFNFYGRRHYIDNFMRV